MGVFERILCPLDFSRHSNRALDTACALAREHKAELTILHAYVIPAYPLPEGYLPESPETVAEILSQTEDAMNAARTKALDSGVASVEALTTEGSPFPEIVRVARELNSDLIVIATHGRTGLKHVLLGSVTERVVREAPCAVLTIRDPEQSFAKP